VRHANTRARAARKRAVPRTRAAQLPRKLTRTPRACRGHMLAGSIAGMSEHAFMFPADTVKTRMQVSALHQQVS